MTHTKLNIVILAAGKGTRMQSALPKVLHRIAGKHLLQHVIDHAKKLNPEKIIVVCGYGAEEVQRTFQHEDIIWAMQAQQLGTGHAMQQALTYLDDDAKTLILLGDVPLIEVDWCEKLLNGTQYLGLLTVHKENPTGYGRIIRENNQVSGIVEQKDATSQQYDITEVNTGIMIVDNSCLARWLPALNNQNSQGEYYLTDIVAMAKAEDKTIATETVQDEYSVEGVNSKQDLAKLERTYQLSYANSLMSSGVTLYDPHRIDIRGLLVTGIDVEIDVGCIFEGEVSLGDGVKVSAYCHLKNCNISNQTFIAPYTHIDGANIANDCRIGPFARIRPGTDLNAEAHIGNFVEIKNSQIGMGTKINHLSYVGDSKVGKYVNIGAGTITCNYDGANKFETVIEDNVFIGSDSQLVAPVTISKGATIGAGSTITKNAPAGELTISRARQITITGWKRPQKQNK